MKYIYLVNRFQHGKKTEPIIRKLRRASEHFKRDYAFKVCRSPQEHLSFIQGWKNPELILTTIGGDGSINYLLNALAETGYTLSFIPFGTGNDFFRGCLETLSTGIHEADIVRINDHYFMNNACFGIDADIANDEHFIHNHLIPKPLRFHAGVISHFLTFKKGRELRIECGGEIIEGRFTTVIAANSQYYGGGYRVSPGSRIDDGVMEIYLVDQLSRPRMAKVILSMKKAGHLEDPSLRMIRTDRLTVSSALPFEANIDGEPLLSDRFDLELIPRGIRLDFNKEFIEYFRKV